MIYLQQFNFFSLPLKGGEVAHEGMTKTVLNICAYNAGRDTRFNRRVPFLISGHMTKNMKITRWDGSLLITHCQGSEV